MRWELEPERREVDVERKGARRLVDATGGAAGGEAVGGRGPVDTAESPERAEPRENSHGWKYKSFFVFLLSLSLFRFFFTPLSRLFAAVTWNVL